MSLENLNATKITSPDEGELGIDRKISSQPAAFIGRKAVISEQIIETICENIGIGMPKHRAAPIGGISIRTFYNWMAKAAELADLVDEEANEVLTSIDLLYLHLLHRVQLAEAKVMKDGVEAIRAEGPSGWRWLLPRLFRAEFGEHVEISTPAPREFQLELPGLIDEGED